MKTDHTFIDIYTGCGGLSLGLMKAGWHGLFAVEKEANAFATLSHNLINPRHKRPAFDWPAWLPQQPHSVESFLSTYKCSLRELEGKVTLLAGGPPCQGFSTIGRRNERDRRNQAFRRYLKLVRILQPRMVLMENVRGITMPFVVNGNSQRTFAEVIQAAMEKIGYDVWTGMLLAKQFGVPQRRPRFILIALKRETGVDKPGQTPFDVLEKVRVGFLKKRRLCECVTVKEALSDLQTSQTRLVTCAETPRFQQGVYGTQESAYQELLHGGMNGEVADSHRLAKHGPEIVKKFRWFLAHCPKGKKLEPEERGDYANKKHTVYILDPNSPAPTVTTLPDDLLHYAEPRILTVREMARLQSFPDDFEFKGKYTTGGKERVKECPRYTQVGNAVPPLLAEAIGEALLEFLDEIHDT